MASKQIRVSPEHYAALEKRKREGETFDDVVARLLSEQPDYSAGAGSWSGTDRAEGARRARREMNAGMERRASDAAETRSSQDGESDP